MFINGCSLGASSRAGAGDSARSSKRLKNKRNFFVLESSKSNDANYLAADQTIVEMHKFGDVGRIANRYAENRWDAW